MNAIPDNNTIVNFNINKKLVMLTKRVMTNVFSETFAWDLSCVRSWLKIIQDEP